MNGLDSSFEALAFIPVNLSPLFSTLWAWLAVATAAFSFWRLRTSSVKTTSSSSHIPPPPLTTTTVTTSFKVINDEREKFDEKDDEKLVLTRGNSKKFFTVFYEEREADVLDYDYDDYDDEMDGCDEFDQEEECVVIKRWGSTGSTIEMIRSLSLSSSSSEFDLGWYSYQDRKVIDGSVVRLWEEDRESSGCGSGSPRGCRRRCFTGVTTHLALA